MSRVVAVVLAALVAGGGVLVSALTSVPGTLLAGMLSGGAGMAVLVAVSELGFVGVGYPFTKTDDFGARSYPGPSLTGAGGCSPSSGASSPSR